MDLASSSYARYTTVAIALHWVIAAIIIGQLAVGLWMSDAIEGGDEQTRFLAYQAIQIHKAFGLTVLALSVARLAWRLAHPAPPLPAAMPGWQKAASHISHVLLYAFMIGAPLTGWAMSSISVEYSALPTTWFGLFTIPHLPLLSFVGIDAQAAAADLAHLGHEVLGWLGIALIAVHVGAALKHHLVDGDAILARMTPGVSPRAYVVEPPAPRAGALSKAVAGGLAAAAAAAVAALFLLQPPAADASASVRVAAASGDAPVWTVTPEASRLGFSGTHTGATFTGVFEAWSADIRFDPARLDASSAQVVVMLASAKTGDSQYDGTLPSADWFDVANHPEAVFDVETFTRGDAPGTYLAAGALTLKGATAPLSLPFTLTIEGDRAVMSGEAVIDRLAFGLGRGSDPTGDWVSKEISVTVALEARRGDGE